MVSVHDGSSFFTSDEYGDANDTDCQGLFYRDTRFLSLIQLRVNSQKPVLISSEQVDYFTACFFTTLPFSSINQAHPLAVIRTRIIGNGVHEDIVIENYTDIPRDLVLTMTFDCDFADLFEIKANTLPLGKTTFRHDAEKNQLIFEYNIDTLHRETIISFDEFAVLAEKTLTYTITVPAKGKWKSWLSFTPVWDHSVQQPKYFCSTFAVPKPDIAESMEAWLDRTPKICSDSDTLDHTCKKSIIDLAALRFYIEPEGEPVLAAGLPWYMALFGRDSLITAYQSAFMAPDIGENILRTLARYQGTEINDFRDETPGKILHELRFGELTMLGLSPHNPYYGSVDATPLFLILLHEIYQWTGDTTLVNDLKEPAMKALYWIDHFGDLDGDGYVEYIKKSTKGLDNQCWKDSWNSMLYSNGSLATPPIAAVEVQGYVYDAKQRMASLSETVWHDPVLAEKLRHEAKDLKQRFNRDFWIADKGGYFALALERDKHQVDAMTSNIGHLLWSGIVDEEKASLVAKQLMGEHLYSGWGVRTMSTYDEGVNPIEYHNGTIWPHDNGLIADGLMRYGYYEEANRIITDMFAAAHYFEYRLPEVFAGYPREPIQFPVSYPTASCPQAWASGAPLLMVRLMLGLQPDFTNGKLLADPHLPKALQQLQAENIHLFGKQYSVTIHANTVKVEETTPRPIATASV